MNDTALPTSTATVKQSCVVFSAHHMERQWFKFQCYHLQAYVPGHLNIPSPM